MAIVPVPETISDFSDALGLAFELSDEFAFAQAGVVIDDRCRCIDFAVFTRIGSGLTPTIRWLSDRADRYPTGARLLLISVRSVDGVLVAEQDLAEFRFAHFTAAGMGLTLIDWIETDGDMVRSYAYLTSPNSDWSAQAVAEGAVDVTDW